jgi:hypothetical protein
MAGAKKRFALLVSSGWVFVFLAEGSITERQPPDSGGVGELGPHVAGVWGEDPQRQGCNEAGDV